MLHFLMFGSQPRLSLAEACAVIGSDAPLLVGSVALFEREEWDGAWLQERLAGTVKLGDVVLTCAVDELTAERIAGVLPEREGEGRLTFALSVLAKGGRERWAIELKKILQARGRSVRWFADKQGCVSPAAVAKLKLTSEGYDVTVVFEGEMAHVCLTTQVQNADAWSLRDYGRPCRDARNGMLPPKLARVMINLGRASGGCLTILDPFCGSGTILMEAALMDERLHIVGTDIEERQVADTKRNLDWLVKQRLISEQRREKVRCFKHDARTIDEVMREPVDLVVTEGCLGRPLKGHETLVQLEREVHLIEELWRGTLRALARVQPEGGVVVGVWPMLQTAHGRASVDLEKEIEQLGYEMADPLAEWSKKSQPLVYARADQRTQRRVVVMRRV